MQAEDLSHSKLCLLSPLRGSAAPESRVSVLCLVIRGFQAVILSPVLGPGRAHLQTSGVHITYCNNPRLVCWWWGLRIQHVAAVTWHGLLSCYATLTARHWTPSTTPQSQDGWSSEWSRANWEHRRARQEFKRILPDNVLPTKFGLGSGQQIWGSAKSDTLLETQWRG